MGENELVIEEWRGVEGLVAAEVLSDTSEAITFGDVFPIAGVAEISKTTESSNDTHYYDNIAAVVISGEGADTITINASALPLEVEGKITGQVYDENTGALIEGVRKTKYFALGYITEKTNGDKVFVWRYKGMFAKPDKGHKTKDNGTDASGQSLTYTNVVTTHKFTKNENQGAKALNVDTGKDLADVTTFFDAVTTPDTLVAKTARTLTITQAANTTVTVKKGSQTLATGATIHDGDILTISVTGGTITVNDTAFISGNMHVVTGNVTVVSTAVA